MEELRETDYLVTACCAHMGMKEAERELSCMRCLGEAIAAQSPSGLCLMNAYRRLAPDLVKRINLSNKRNALLEFGFEKIKEISRLADKGDEKTAAAYCVLLVMHLEEQLRDKTDNE